MLAVDWNLPVSHAAQCAADSCDCEPLPYRPAEHATQALLPVASWYCPVAQAGHAADPALLHCPSGHASHAAAPGLLKFPAAHGAQLSPPLAAWNLPPSHCLQSVALAPLYFPAGHESHTVVPMEPVNLPASQFGQNAWPTMAWCLPLGHEMHTAELDKLLNLPVMQAAHNRFDTVDGVAGTLEPAAQVVCATQNVLPASLWNSVAPHAMQPGALLSPEYCPDGHNRQRSGVLLVLSLSNWPGTQAIFTSQNGWPAST